MKTEPTRTRDGGTRVVQPKTPEEKIAALRDIVKQKQYAKVDGVTVDLFTASAIIAVYDSMSAPHQVKFAALPVRKMAHIAVQFVK